MGWGPNIINTVYIEQPGEMRCRAENSKRNTDIKRDSMATKQYYYLFQWRPNSGICLSTEQNKRAIVHTAVYFFSYGNKRCLIIKLQSRLAALHCTVYEKRNFCFPLKV